MDKHHLKSVQKVLLWKLKYYAYCIHFGESFMNSGILWGLTLAVLSGTLDGSMALPMQFASRWRWENIWLVYSLFGMILLPWLVAFLTLSNALKIYEQA